MNKLIETMKESPKPSMFVFEDSMYRIKTLRYALEQEYAIAIAIAWVWTDGGYDSRIYTTGTHYNLIAYTYMYVPHHGPSAKYSTGCTIA